MVSIVNRNLETMSWKEYESKSTQELINEIRNKSEPENEEISEDAFRAFTFRLSPDVLHKSRIVARNWGYDEGVGDEIAEYAFDRFWKYPKGFTIEKCKDGNVDRCILFYLFQIAQNRLIDYGNETGTDSNPYTGDEELVLDYPDLEKLGLSEASLKELHETYGKIKSALDSLSIKHRIIYLTYHAYEQKGFKMPRQLLKKLRDELTLNQNSIRVYKKEANEAVAKVKNYGG